LDGEQIQRFASKEVARRIGLLAQNATTPGDITVQELVSRGRYPHQPLFTRWRKEDDEAVKRAMQATGITDLAQQSVDTLSGGQRQRAWIAMLVAQDSRCLLLGEPTSALDIAHQVDVLALVHRLSQQRGLTVIAVLHDINMAARYCDYLVALRGGEMIAQGTPAELMRSETLEHI
ncbi:ATP-binding cassette domain-containing protein, partial [Escherichia coli]|nr:ATP-binding cassette domain-containing protein [Escherichia coli]